MSWTAIPVAFLAGMVSFLAPCVLPLVPGYLSAVSAVDAERLGEPGTGRRVVVTSVPFVLGFTAFFVLLGVGAALVGGRLFADQFLLEKIAGFVLVVFGLAFMGLLPWPERLLGAGLLQEARSRGSRVLLGGAFAVCAAPCIGPVLAGILVGDSIWLGSFRATASVAYNCDSITTPVWLTGTPTSIYVSAGDTRITCNSDGSEDPFNDGNGLLENGIVSEESFQNSIQSYFGILNHCRGGNIEDMIKKIAMGGRSSIKIF